MALCLTQYTDTVEESEVYIVLPDERVIRLVLVEARPGRAKQAYDAPDDVKIYRGKVYRKLMDEQKEGK